MTQQKDKHLDTPAEANTEKHINFLEADENAGHSNRGTGSGHTNEDERRRKEWERGLEEGRKAANQNNTEE